MIHDPGPGPDRVGDQGGAGQERIDLAFVGTQLGGDNGLGKIGIAAPDLVRAQHLNVQARGAFQDHFSVQQSHVGVILRHHQATA